MAGLLALLFGQSAFATGEYDALTTAVNFGSAQTAILAVFATLAGIYVIIKGAKIIMQTVKGG